MKPFGPYSPVRRTKDLLFISGQVGVNPLTHQAGLDIRVQTKQALQNMKHILQTEGMDMQNVIKTTIFLTDMDMFADVNSIYEQAFIAPRPARSAVAVKELPRVAGDIPILVEIEAIASEEAA